MPLTAPQIKWLDDFSSVKIDADKARDAVEARRLTQSMIELELGDKRDALRGFLEGVEAKVPPDSVFQKVKAAMNRAETIRALEPGGDPMKELDIWHDSDIIKYFPPEKLADIQKKIGELVELGARMSEMTYGEPPEKVYSDPAQISADLWQPLVREGIIPENFVPPKYSEVETTFGAAAELYEVRLQEYTKELGDWDDFARKFEVGTACLKLGFDIAGAVVDANAAIEAIKLSNPKDYADTDLYKNAKKTVDLLGLVGASIAAVGTGTKTAVTDKDVVKSLDSFTTVIANAVTAAAGKGVGKEVNAVITAVVHAYPFAKRIKTWRETGAWDWSEAIGDLGDAVSKGIGAGDGSSDSTFYQNIGKAVKEGFDVVALGVKTVDMSSEERVLSAIAAQIGKATSAIAGAIVDIMKEKETDAKLEEAKDEKGSDLTDDEKDAIKDKVEKEYELTLKLLEAGEDLEKVAEQLEEKQKVLAEAATAFDESEKERLLEQSAQAQTAALKTYMETPDPEFEAMLASGFSADAYEDAPDEDDESPEAAQKRAVQEERRIKSLEKLIEIHKQNEATYALAKTVGTIGLKGAEALLKEIPGIGIVAVAAQMIDAFYKAAKQGSEFLVWQDNVAMASAAHTVQVEAILNRQGLQKRQTIEAGIDAALKAAKLVGEALKFAGHAAPVGFAVSAAATTAAALLEAASKVATEIEMHNAWKEYQAALATPQDRKQVRIALRSNPTLAKYAMAYGAVIEGNAVAKEVMRRCGLNDTTLADPGTNVGKVVQYLELIYKDDPVVLKATTIPMGWHPGAIELKATSWIMFIAAAQDGKAKDAKRANPLLAAIDATGVAGALQAYEPAAEAAGKGTTDEEKAVSLRSAIAAAERVEVAFLRFRPLTDEDSPKQHKEVTDYVQALSGQVTLQKREWEATLPNG
jgi:hypothetical protein